MPNPKPDATKLESGFLGPRVVPAPGVVAATAGPVLVPVLVLYQSHWQSSSPSALTVTASQSNRLDHQHCQLPDQTSLFPLFSLPFILADILIFNSTSLVAPHVFTSSPRFFYSSASGTAFLSPFLHPKPLALLPLPVTIIAPPPRPRIHHRNKKRPTKNAIDFPCKLCTPTRSRMPAF